MTLDPEAEAMTQPTTMSYDKENRMAVFQDATLNTYTYGELTGPHFLSILDL